MWNVFKLTLEQLFKHIPLIVIFWRELKTCYTSLEMWIQILENFWAENVIRKQENVFCYLNDIKRYFPSSWDHESKVHLPSEQKENILICFNFLKTIAQFKWIAKCWL